MADVGSEIVGTAIGLIREGVWGFSLFAVLPAFQGRGIGSRLYAPALAYGAGEPGGIILSSSHPAAIRRLPSARDTGCCRLSISPVSPTAPGTCAACRPGDLRADAQTIDAASRHVRGASHMLDMPILLGAHGTTRW